MKARLNRITNAQYDNPQIRNGPLRVRTASEARTSLVDSKKSALKHYPKPRGLIPK
jgi:hypothetical protein